jgi:hypothetical protein
LSKRCLDRAHMCRIRCFRKFVNNCFHV